MYEQSPDRDQINRPIDELHYEPVNPRFRSVQIVSAVIAYSLLAVLALLLLLVDTYWWCIAAEIVITVSFIINLKILRKAYKFKGYALREHDITYRGGVIFPKITTVPFSKIQQVSIKQNPRVKVFRSIRNRYSQRGTRFVVACHPRSHQGKGRCNQECHNTKAE